MLVPPEGTNGARFPLRRSDAFDKVPVHVSCISFRVHDARSKPEACEEHLCAAAAMLETCLTIFLFFVVGMLLAEQIDDCRSRSRTPGPASRSITPRRGPRQARAIFEALSSSLFFTHPGAGTCFSVASAQNCDGCSLHRLKNSTLD